MNDKNYGYEESGIDILSSLMDTYYALRQRASELSPSQYYFIIQLTDCYWEDSICHLSIKRAHLYIRLLYNDVEFRRAFSDVVYEVLNREFIMWHKFNTESFTVWQYF